MTVVEKCLVLTHGRQLSSLDKTAAQILDEARKQQWVSFKTTEWSTTARTVTLASDAIAGVVAPPA